MGVRRKSRARLGAVHKEGKDLRNDVLDTTSNISNATVSMTQQRTGQMIITDLVLDWGTSNASFQNQATASNSVVGTATTQAGYICQVTDAVMGIVTSVEVATTEAITTGTDADYDLVYCASANGKLGGEPGTSAISAIAGCADIGAIGFHGLQGYDNQELKNKYLYLVAGAAATKRASCTIDCSSATVGNLVSGINSIKLLAGAAGTTAVTFTMTGSLNFDASAVAGLIGINNANTTAKLADGIHRGINNNANFTASYVAGTSVVTVTKASTITQYENTANTLVDAYTASGIEMTDFSGGIPNALSSGKTLIRLTGHKVPDNL